MRGRSSGKTGPPATRASPGKAGGLKNIPALRPGPADPRSGTGCARGGLPWICMGGCGGTLPDGARGRPQVATLHTLAQISVGGDSHIARHPVMRHERRVRVWACRPVRVRLGCFTNLHRQSARSPMPRMVWTLELQRWPHTSDACGPAP